jgi:hypothetical protein
VSSIKNDLNLMTSVSGPTMRDLFSTTLRVLGVASNIMFMMPDDVKGESLPDSLHNPNCMNSTDVGRLVLKYGRAVCVYRLRYREKREGERCELYMRKKCAPYYQPR